MDDFFELLKQHLLSINLDEASEIVFCTVGGKGIWPRTEKLINELSLSNAKQILDYTHAPFSGDYTKKRSELLNNITLDEIVTDIKAKRKVK